MEAVKEKVSVSKALEDIVLSVKWAHISMDYFGKSRSWFSQKLNGYDGNRKENDFSDEERETLKNALFDLSERIRRTAQKL